MPPSVESTQFLSRDIARPGKLFETQSLKHAASSCSNRTFISLKLGRRVHVVADSDAEALMELEAV